MSRRSMPLPFFGDSLATNNRDLPPIQIASLEFLTFTNFDQSIDSETKRKVRSHVMSGVHRKRAGRVNPDVSESVAHQLRSSGNAILTAFSVPHPIGLGIGRSEPFTSYPIHMDLRYYELFDQLFRENCFELKNLNRIGFFSLTLQDEAAFLQILCTSSRHMVKFHHGIKSTEALLLSTEVIRSVYRRVVDPDLCVSNGVIIAILTLACHAALFEDRHGARIHSNALDKIIQRRGGPQAFEYHPVLRMVLFWVDVKTAFFYDHIPRFPIPVLVQHEATAQYAFLHPDRAFIDVCYTDYMISAVNDLFALVYFMDDKEIAEDQRGDILFTSILVVMHKLLSVRHEISNINDAVVREESCRVGILLYLALIWYEFGVYVALDVYIRKLKYTMRSQDKLNSGVTSRVKLWLLIVGGIQSLDLEDQKWFVSAIASLTICLGYKTWEEIMAALREVVWVEGTLLVECDKLHKELVSELRDSFAYPFS